MTMLEVLDAHRGLPTLVDRFLKLQALNRALEVANVIRALQVHVEVFQVTQTALLNMHGTMDPDSRQKVVFMGTDGFEPYRDAQKELLESVVEVGVSKIEVTPKVMDGMDPTAFIAMSSLLEFTDGEHS